VEFKKREKEAYKMSAKKLIKLTKEEDNVVVRIPVSLIITTQKYRDNGYKITDKDAALKYTVENLAEFGEDQETGCTAFEEVIDRMFDDAFECGEEWLEELPDSDCD
jgi:hypothetical protein